MAFKLRVVLLVALLLGFGCSDDSEDSNNENNQNNVNNVNNTNSLVCGEGTEARDGECVSTVVQNQCGEGTTLMGTECVPDNNVTPVECATGTTLMNNRCEPDVACGPGTTANASGECVPDSMIACGAGTVETNGECLPDPTAVVTCAGSTVLVEQECLSRAEALAASTPTPSVEPDDPTFGGTETALTLPAVGDFIVASGVIDVPEDLDSNGQLDQDEDYFTFTGSAGDVLEIELVNDGLAEPHVRLQYKDTTTYTWEKTLPINVTIDPIRYFVLPRDGEYQLVVTHAAKYRQLVPRPILGSPDYKYFVVIEHAPALAPTDVTLPTTVTGNFATHTDSAVRLVNAGGEGFAVVDGTFNTDAFEAEITSLDATGRFSATDITPNPLAFSVRDNTTFLVEWEQFAPGADDFTMNIDVLPSQAAGTTLSNEALTPGAYNFYSFHPPQNSLVEINVTLASGPASDLEPVIALNNFDLININQEFTISGPSVTMRHFHTDTTPLLIVIADAQPGPAGDYAYDITFDATPVNVVGTVDTNTTSVTGTTAAVDNATTEWFAVENGAADSAQLTTTMSPTNGLETLMGNRYDVDAGGKLSPESAFTGQAGMDVQDVTVTEGGGYALYEVTVSSLGMTTVGVSTSFVQPQIYTSSPAATISNAAIINDTITVPGTCTVADITVQMDINHSYIGDIRMDLTSPGGTTVRLWNSSGGSQSQIVGTFPTTLNPAQSLTPFVTGVGNGDWTLTIEDTFGGDDGTLNSWGITLFCN